MQSLTAVVLGATGLTGSHVVQQLLKNSAFSKVRILVRRPFELSHPKLEVKQVNFENLHDYRSKLGTGDSIFCCIGTTQNKVNGDRDAYRKIDFDIPVNAAKMGKDAGFTKYLLISAVGANSLSNNFYLKLKGEVEKEIASVSYTSFHVFRPSILYGDRKETRLGETIGKVVMRGLSGLMIGSAEKYRGIESETIAKAMIAAATSTNAGMFVHHYADMMDAAKSVA